MSKSKVKIKKDRSIVPLIARWSGKCYVCLDFFDPGEKVQWAPKTKHTFHDECILSYPSIQGEM